MQEVAGETKYATEMPSANAVEGAASATAAGGQAPIGQMEKVHHDYLIKEMLWMQEDFERERKKK